MTGSALRVTVGGDDAAELSLAGEHGTHGRLVSSVAFPPGAPLSFWVTGTEGPLRVGAKSFGARRLDDGRYESTVKFVNLRREERAELHRLLGSDPE